MSRPKIKLARKKKDKGSRKRKYSFSSDESDNDSDEDHRRTEILTKAHHQNLQRKKCPRISMPH